MKTIVYQSYRTQQVPAWITTCMGTVRAWAAQQGFDYRFYDDAFFDRAPQWFRDKAQIGKLDVGTKFLSGLRAVLPYPLLENVGMLSPRMLQEIAHGQPLHLRRYAQGLLAPLACANLCGSLQGRPLQGVVPDDALYATVVGALLSSRGEVVNALRPAGC